jgi:hypothetical protein
MTKHTGPTHVVVDGSNIATEGRSAPSLAQLNDAVLAFMAERPDITVTVVVDATFGHRINKSESKEFDEAVANNELVAPPAGAVGRGDAFVLGIADKAGALVLSNDSFQEFHGHYEWLFDQGRLIGGKPVPHVGWVFVERVPVRGPTSRKAVRDSQRDRRVRRDSGVAPRQRRWRSQPRAQVSLLLVAVAQVSRSARMSRCPSRPLRLRDRHCDLIRVRSMTCCPSWNSWNTIRWGPVSTRSLTRIPPMARM